VTASLDAIPVPLTKIDQFILWLVRHWVLLASLVLGVYALTPFLAPLFMTLGWAVPGRLIYLIYSFFCHQLPERSYFLFGAKFSYSLSEIQTAWNNTNNIVILRQFAGNAQMGWKVAWSDRMVSMFTSLWLFGILWGLVKTNTKRISWWFLILLLLPTAVDGTTHFISDMARIGQGFRDSNTWLAVITHHALPRFFYAGDAWGSFNAWMRLITGVLFGFGMVWFGFPYIDEVFKDSAQAIDYKYQCKALFLDEKARLLNSKYSRKTW
jgi:uncharacterized membrane protein